MTPRKLYKELAALVVALANCEKSGNTEWHGRHNDRITALVREHMPSGGGWDCGTKIELDKCNANKLVFTGSYHHMNDGGMYDGWTDHTITVTPSFDGFDLRISGRDRNEIKEYLYDSFANALDIEIARD